MGRVLGIRGATTADDNIREAVLEATREMLIRIVEENAIDLDDVAAAFFTTTRDLNAEFPALAARQSGWDQSALMCAHEMDVPGGLPQCIRVLVLVNTDKRPKDIRHAYLKGAVNLKDRDGRVVSPEPGPLSGGS